MKAIGKIKILPVAFESLGVRSMCTYIETPDIKILLDAGVSLGPNRFGFQPHCKEYVALRDRRQLILDLAEKADLVTISHYHFDHHTPSFTDWTSNWSSAEIAQRIYGGKLVFLKDYNAQINLSQRRRGWMFSITGGRHAKKLEVADGGTFKFGNTTMSFSSPVYHGLERSELGWVLMIMIRLDENSILFAPDVQGPSCTETLNVILAEKPELAIVGGPPLYLADYKVSLTEIESATRNLQYIVSQVPTTVLDHHVLRDDDWKEKMQPVFSSAMATGHEVLTAAEFAGEKSNLLESFRKTLYETEPPSQQFIEWTKIPAQKRMLILPPI